MLFTIRTLEKQFLMGIDKRLYIHLINFIDMAEEHSNIKEANDLLKLATVLDPNSISELEIEWYMAIK